MAKILVVDDSKSLRLQIKSVLESAGHTVLQGQDGFDGYAVAEENQNIDLIISDYAMPGTNGIDMVSRIRQFERYQNIPIAMLTTESSDELKAQGKKAGVFVWFIKPFNEEHFAESIDLVIQKFNELNTGKA